MWCTNLSAEHHDAVCQQSLQWNNEKNYCELFEGGKKGGEQETLGQLKTLKTKYKHMHTYI